MQWITPPEKDLAWNPKPDTVAPKDLHSLIQESAFSRTRTLLLLSLLTGQR